MNSSVTTRSESPSGSAPPNLKNIEAHDHPTPSNPAEKFMHDAAAKAADLEHREIIRKNMESYDAAHLRGRSRFRDWEAARQRCQEIKREAINHLDRYLLQFEKNVTARGGHVFWAATSEEACAYISELAVRHNVKTVVKSKSMVTEEIQLATALEKTGATVWETDLGEYIVQLRNEAPYHIVTPAMHLNRQQIGDLFRDKLDPSLSASNDPQELVAAARRKLRQAFFVAEMGISGANFLVADPGLVAISTNEGNGRLSTSLPRIHVAVTGIEKIIPRLEDLATLWPVLATSGTGQPITTYGTLVGGPKRAEEPDGPEEFHVVLVDNGRSSLLAHHEEREVLHCIRCGACLNICPVYRHIGGHSYRTTYPGPIGSVLTPHLRGSEFNHLSYASSLCGACTSVCPVRIDLHHHLLHNRRDFVQAGDSGSGERLKFKMFRRAMQSPWFYAFGGWLMRTGLRLLYRAGLAGSTLDPMRAWNRGRSPVPLPRTSFRSLWKKGLQNGK
ncbi:MAG TPA: LutB/LldF family L-lactate oxidation iron-sulfur protein [Terriglobales bacterium]|nr:LutB/LldF family L-lactate oxidation iron-sulfur protein [Terriglobales bacterium]